MGVSDKKCVIYILVDYMPRSHHSMVHQYSESVNIRPKIELILLLDLINGNDPISKLMQSACQQ